MPDLIQSTREALLDAAETLFSQRGHAAVGTREIAEHAGANLASIKYHFGSKHDLYLETVRRAMTAGADDNPWSLLEDCPLSADAAGVRLASFVRRFLEQLVSSEEPPACATFMLWEAVQPSEAIDDVVQEYITPNRDRLVALVCILMPEAGDEETEFVARSVLAQVLHHLVFRAFIARNTTATGPSRSLTSIADHIVRFSLRGMGYEEPFIADVLQRTDEQMIRSSSE